MYHERLIEKEIERKLATSGAVLVAGPKFCGKTTTCMLYQKSLLSIFAYKPLPLDDEPPLELPVQQIDRNNNYLILMR